MPLWGSFDPCILFLCFCQTDDMALIITLTYVYLGLFHTEINPKKPCISDVEQSVCIQNRGSVSNTSKRIRTSHFKINIGVLQTICLWNDSECFCIHLKYTKNNRGQSGTPPFYHFLSPEVEKIGRTISSNNPPPLSLCGFRITSVYFGGGTPSLASPLTIDAILDSVSQCVHLAEGAEVTLEANPASADALCLSKFQKAGVNRLSIGIQVRGQEHCF